MDTLKQLGRTLGQNGRGSHFGLRRGGYLPQVERSRGILTTSIPYISYVVVDSNTRKVSLSLAFQEET